MDSIQSLTRSFDPFEDEALASLGQSRRAVSREGRVADSAEENRAVRSAYGSRCGLRPLRIALFTDSYTETNGVATVSRKLTEFARDANLPFLCVYGGRTTRLEDDGSLRLLELRRGFAAFRADHDLYCDPLVGRHRDRVVEVLRDFRADVVHITGPGDIGVMGFWAAHILRIPLVASWHTNLHEYMGRRLEKTLAFLPENLRRRLADGAQELSMEALAWFYRLPRFLLAPNIGTANVLERRSGRPTLMMGHGVDLRMFQPRAQNAAAGAEARPESSAGAGPNPGPAAGPDRPFRIGYVGRLTPEKNVRALAQLEQKLLAAGAENFRFLLVGEGSEHGWLAQHMHRADLPGVLRGRALADAFASMDAFVFPSRTDTYGLVILEAMASGVPVVVHSVAASVLGMRDGEAGLVAQDFAEPVLRLMREPALRRRLGLEARRFACARGWESVFEQLYATYERGLAIPDVRRELNEARRGIVHVEVTGD